VNAEAVTTDEQVEQLDEIHAEMASAEVPPLENDAEIEEAEDPEAHLEDNLSAKRKLDSKKRKSPAEQAKIEQFQEWLYEQASKKLQHATGVQVFTCLKIYGLVFSFFYVLHLIEFRRLDYQSLSDIKMVFSYAFVTYFANALSTIANSGKKI
jgi:hypothetical protein